MVTTTIQNSQIKEHLRKLIQEQLAYFEETGKQQYSVTAASKLIGYKNRRLIKNTIIEMFSRELYNRIFGAHRGCIREAHGGALGRLTEQEFVGIIRDIGLKKSGKEGIVTEKGIKMFRQAQEGKTPPGEVKLELSCQIEGHQKWEAFFYNILDRESWCRKCAANRRTFTWMDAYLRGLNKNPSMEFYLKETPETLVAKKANLPEGTAPSWLKLDWECKEGHKISKSYAQIGIRGCKQCFHEGMAITYEMAEKSAIIKGYKLATTPTQFKKIVEQAFKDKVKPSQVKLKYSCGKHAWYTTHSSMMVKTSRCPTCDSGYYETRTRKNFKQVFRLDLNKVRMKEVLNNKQGVHGRLEYDGYATFYVAGRKVKVAFEYNGEQHYFYPNGRHRSYNQWLKALSTDEQKVSLSQAENIILITIPYHFYQRAGADTYIQKFIISQFEQQVRSIYGVPGFKFTKKAVSTSSSSLLNFIGKKP